MRRRLAKIHLCILGIYFHLDTRTGILQTRSLFLSHSPFVSFLPIYNIAFLSLWASSSTVLKRLKIRIFFFNETQTFALRSFYFINQVFFRYSNIHSFAFILNLFHPFAVGMLYVYFTWTICLWSSFLQQLKCKKKMRIKFADQKSLDKNSNMKNDINATISRVKSSTLHIQSPHFVSFQRFSVTTLLSE